MPFEVLKYVVLFQHVNAELRSFVNIGNRIDVHRILTDHQAVEIENELDPFHNFKDLKNVLFRILPGWDRLLDHNVQQEIKEKNKSKKMTMTQVAQFVLQIVFCG